MGHDQELKWLAFSLYQLSFFLYSPWKRLKGFEFESNYNDNWYFKASKEKYKNKLLTRKNIKVSLSDFNLKRKSELKSGLNYEDSWWKISK